MGGSGRLKYWEYRHSPSAKTLTTDRRVEISAALRNRDSLVVGDSQGKIYVLQGYLSGTTYSVSKLEWHTGPVSTLAISHNYLYSGGEESVVVLWHLLDHSRDYLPRVGTQISQLFVDHSNNEVMCAMADGSVKVVGVGRDKTVVSYHLVLDPLGGQHGGVLYNGVLFNGELRVVCLPYIAGRLQFLDLMNPKSE